MWLFEFNTKQTLDVLRKFVPPLGVFVVDLVAQVPQNFGRSALSNADIDCAGVEPGLSSGQP